LIRVTKTIPINICQNCNFQYMAGHQMTVIKVMDLNDNVKESGPYCEACMKRGFLLKDRDVRSD